MPTTASTDHPIIETFTQAGWTLNQEASQPKFWFVFERKTKSGITFEIQFLLDGCEASYFIKGADFGSPFESVEQTLKNANEAVQHEILFGGWAEPAWGTMLTNAKTMGETMEAFNQVDSAHDVHEFIKLYGEQIGDTRQAFENIKFGISYHGSPKHVERYWDTFVDSFLRSGASK